MQIEVGKLRPVQEADLEKVLSWRNSERIRRSSLTDHIISRHEHWKWYSSIDQHNITLLIFEYMNRPVGVVNFTEKDTYSNKCKWGFYLGETDLPKGTGLLMGYLGLEFAFENLKIRKLCSEVISFNKLSIKYHERLFFIQEGCLKEHVWKDGIYEDVIVMALFTGVWELRKPFLKQEILSY